MNENKISYALAKQLPTAYAISTNYGAIELDEEMRAAIEKTLRRILERRLRMKDNKREAR